MKKKESKPITGKNMRVLYHGSPMIVEKPELGKGNPRNDYGLGFYCTESIELAKEWACLNNIGGFVNEYRVDIDCLRVLKLSEARFTILHWLAILVNNRTFRISNQIAAQANEYLLFYFLADLAEYDAVIGYRADDSYFAFAMDFLNNAISLRQLERAMYLGKLGEQLMIRSQKAFETIQFIGSKPVDGEIYYAKRLARDNEAREQYLKGERISASVTNDMFMIDILRQEMKPDDTRLQRKIPE